MKLRDYQQRCVDATFAHAMDGEGNGLIVVPTGGGKSVIIAATCKQLLEKWPRGRILKLTHVKELVQQNAERILQYWPEAPLGIYSASLGRRNTAHPIIMATIQSVFNKAEVLGHFDMILIDECHLCSPNAEGMYLKMLTRLWEINKNVRIYGYSATPYRLDSGPLVGEDSLFQETIAEITIKELVEAGHLSRLVSKISEVEANLSAVRITAGEYNAADQAKAFGGDFIKAAMPDMLRLATGRRHGIIFCPTVEFADSVAALLRARGETAMSISGTTPRAERDAGLAAFKAGKYRWLCSVNLVTTGFDAPIVDCIVLWRATMSPGLYYQMVGRGLRISPEKVDCLVLDYGENIINHGPITRITPPEKKRGGKRAFVAKVKVCPVCRSPNELGALECEDCGISLAVERDHEKKLHRVAADVDIMDFSEPEPEWVEVDMVGYYVHRKDSNPESLRIQYQCGMMVYKKWFFPRSKSVKARYECDDFIRGILSFDDYEGSGAHFANAADLVKILNNPLVLVKNPTRIRIQKNGKYTEVVDYDFRPLPQTRHGISDAGSAANYSGIASY